MAGSIVGKALHDQWRAVAVWTVLSGLLAAFYLSLYPSIGGVAEMKGLLEAMPPAIRAMFAAETVDISTAAGYLNVELFTFMVPLLVLAVAVTSAGGATAGEEEHGTLQLLLAKPVPRWQVVVEKYVALAIETAVLVAGIWIALAAAAGLGGIQLAVDRVAAALVSAWLLGLAIGAVGLALGALTGNRMISIGVALAIAVGGFFINALGPLVDWLGNWRWLSPHYHYLGYDPLTNGLDAGHAAALIAGAVVGVAVAIVAFERRQLRG